MYKKILLILVGILLVGGVFALAQNQNIEGVVVKDINITNNTNPICVFEDEDIYLNSIIDLPNCQGNVWLELGINGDYQNQTNFTIDEDVYSFFIDKNNTGGGDSIFWQYFAIDCFNVTGNSSLENFYVNYRTSLSVNPISPNGLNNWYIINPTFTLTNSDAGTIWYRWDGTGNLNYTQTGPFSTENAPNNQTFTGGIIEVTWWGDICDEEEQNQTFYIDLTDPQIINESPGENSIVFNEKRPEIYAYLEELYQSNSGINEDSIILKLDGGEIIPNINSLGLDAEISYVPDSDLVLGEHEVSVYVEDNAGRKTERNWTFEIDETPAFTMDIISPNLEEYNSRRVRFDVLLDGDVELEYIDWNERRPRWKRLCRNCDEYNRTKSFRDGEHNITIKAEDDIHTKQENFVFFIDSKSPKISRTMPRRNSDINGSNFYVKFREDNIEEVKLFWNSSKVLDKNTECVFDRYWECETAVDVSEHNGEWIEYYFEVKDGVGNIDQSRITKVFVDSVYPEITINLPNETEQGRRVQFNVSVSEEVKLEYIDLQDPRGRWRRLCSRCDEYGEKRKRTKSFKRGYHEVLIKATDNAGNFDIKQFNFNVDY